MGPRAACDDIDEQGGSRGDDGRTDRAAPALQQPRGADIDPKRLEALPIATRCIHALRELRLTLGLLICGAYWLFSRSSF